MLDDDEIVAAAEKALKTTGLFFSEQCGNGARIIQILRKKYPEAAIVYVALPTSGGFALEAEDRLKPRRTN